MVRGWFVGDFSPTAFNSKECEVSVRRYSAGDYEKKHYHKVATEVTIIVSGTVVMNGKEYTTGDIIIMEPGEPTDFLAKTDAINTVVKIPSVKNDKYLVE